MAQRMRKQGYVAPDLSFLDAQSPYAPDELAASDIDLVAMARNGDVDGFVGLYRRHYGAMLAFAWQYSRSKEQAEDIASEAMASVMSALTAGKGPNVAIRAYLLTAVRNAATKTAKQNRKYVFTDDLSVLEDDVHVRDDVEAQFENGAIARAFAGLPERWQRALWYLDVEGVTPAVAAAALKMRPNAVCALAKRAREGMRRAYMQEHVAQRADEHCRPYASKLASYAHGGLGKNQRKEVSEHLQSCEPCAAALAEINEMQRRVGMAIPLGATAASVFAIVSAISVKDLLMPQTTWAAVVHSGSIVAGAAKGLGTATGGAAVSQSGGAGSTGAGGTAGGSATVAGAVGGIGTIASVAASVVAVAAIAIGASVLGAADQHAAVSAGNVSQLSPAQVAAAPGQPKTVTDNFDPDNAANTPQRDIDTPPSTPDAAVTQPWHSVAPNAIFEPAGQAPNAGSTVSPALAPTQRPSSANQASPLAPETSTTESPEAEPDANSGSNAGSQQPSENNDTDANTDHSTPAQNGDGDDSKDDADGQTQAAETTVKFEDCQVSQYLIDNVRACIGSSSAAKEAYVKFGYDPSTAATLTTLPEVRITIVGGVDTLTPDNDEDLAFTKFVHQTQGAVAVTSADFIKNSDDGWEATVSAGATEIRVLVSKVCAHNCQVFYNPQRSALRSVRLAASVKVN